MMSVTLDEAIDLRLKGSAVKAYETLQMARGVCLRFSQSMEIVLSNLHGHAKHFGLVPNAAPLDAANFRGTRGQRTARITGFLNRVLLSHRSQFIHKVSTLRQMVAELNEEFSNAVDGLITGLSARTKNHWECLDRCQFDLNTCLCETVVLLKSFMVVLPEDQLVSFESGLTLPSVRNIPRTFFRHRRFAAVSGK
jgi:hypothetical protein